jgi:formate C-acetyltransferase
MARLPRLVPDIPEEDWERLAFGGCTETMLEGISAVGSDDAGINTALIFDRYMREHLAECDDFETFFTGLTGQICAEIAETMDILNEYRRTRALYRPQPIHTLFVDDCIDRQRDFNDDGARYCWSVMNVAGMINVIDSLSVIRTLVYENKKYTAAQFIEKMDARDPIFLAEARACPCYGVDDDRVDLLGARLAKIIFDAFDQRECYPRGKFYPVSNQFTTYADAGRSIAATPDGRGCGAPLCDSMGAIHGNDVKGPTALLNSVAKLPLNRVIGTPILNMRMKKEHLSTMLKPLVTGFFQKDGMQLQISCLSREEILDAMAHPENHRNLVVRIGGYSEYFNRLSPELKQSVLERTEH